MKCAVNASADPCASAINRDETELIAVSICRQRVSMSPLSRRASPVLAAANRATAAAMDDPCRMALLISDDRAMPFLKPSFRKPDFSYSSWFITFAPSPTAKGLKSFCGVVFAMPEDDVFTIISHKLPSLCVKVSCQLIKYNGLVGAPVKILTGNFSSVSWYNKIKKNVVFRTSCCSGCCCCSACVLAIVGYNRKSRQFLLFKFRD